VARECPRAFCFGDLPGPAPVTRSIPWPSCRPCARSARRARGQRDAHLSSRTRTSPSPKIAPENPSPADRPEQSRRMTTSGQGNSVKRTIPHAVFVAKKLTWTICRDRTSSNPSARSGKRESAESNPTRNASSHREAAAWSARRRSRQPACEPPGRPSS
jgi:hypothetical protein